MTKALLVHPAFDVIREKHDLGGGNPHHNNIPLAIVSLATHLHHSGVETDVLDLRLYPTEAECDLLTKHLEGVDLVGISAMSAQIPHAYLLARAIKHHFHNKTIVLGGAHASLFPNQTAQSRYVDYSVYGEGEEPLLDIIQGRENPRYASKDKPFSYSDVKSTYLDEDELFDPDYSLIEFDKYTALNGNQCRIPFLSSRGCSSKCTFCINTAMNNPWRGFSAERTVALVEKLYEQYQPIHFYPLDEHFFARRKRALEIIPVFKKLGVTWEANIRIDAFNTFDNEVLQLLRESNINHLRFGAESGSARVLKMINKKIMPEQIRQAVEKAKKHNLHFILSFMKNLPDETDEEIEMTMELSQWCRDMGMHVIGPQRFRPYPGSIEFNKFIKDKYDLPKSLWQWYDIIANERSFWSQFKHV